MSELKSLEKKLEFCENIFLRKSIEADLLKDDLEKKKSSIEASHKRIETLEKILELFHLTSQYARKQATKQIEMIVTNCLQMIFDEDIDLKIELSEQRGRPSAEFYVSDWIGDEKYYYKPEQARGGGIVDTVSLAIRVAFLLKYSENIQGPIVLDEPAKHLSDEYIFNVADFLKLISEQFEKQVILVTHNQHLSSIGELTYYVTKREGESVVERAAT